MISGKGLLTRYPWLSANLICSLTSCCVYGSTPSQCVTVSHSCDSLVTVTGRCLESGDEKGDQVRRPVCSFQMRASISLISSCPSIPNSQAWWPHALPEYSFGTSHGYDKTSKTPDTIQIAPIIKSGFEPPPRESFAAAPPMRIESAVREP